MSYLQKRSKEETITILTAISKECLRLGGPLTKQLFHLVRDRRFLDVINFHFDYTWFFSTDDFVYARQIQALFNKQDFLDLGIDTRAVAAEKFKQSEELCRETNLKFEYASSFSDDVGAVLYYAQREALFILGSEPPESEILSSMSYGPGATTSTNSLIANPRTKLSSSLECSMNLVPMVGRLLVELPMLCTYHDQSVYPEYSDIWHVDVTITPGKLGFVAKNCKADRAIVTEPVLNGLIQRSIGQVIRRRLARVGISLNDQTVNQSLALEGSLSGLLATLDLTSASDTICRAIVAYLLPPLWYYLLDSARTDCVSIPKDLKHLFDGYSTLLLEKFSSMGNGFTFELESLIFYCLAKGVCKYLKIKEPVISVYGDDIILPSSAYELMEKTLEECGFIPNKGKSFSSGPFRESCGADYLNGFDIRPFYQKSLISDRTLFTMHNWFIRHCEFDLADAVIPFIHPSNVQYGPDGYGDGHLVGEWPAITTRKHTRAGWGGSVFSSFELGHRSFKKKLPGDFIYPSYSIYVKSNRGPLEILDPSVPSDWNTIRGYDGYKKISMYTFASSIFARSS